MVENYPLVFGIREPVLGKGFVAGVEANGRALMRHEEEGFWIDGVHPGAVCAGGRTHDEAWLKFRQDYRAILFDFAAAAETFSDFKREVERFFWEETPGEAEAWRAAVEQMKKDPNRGGDWLPRKDDYPEPSVNVVCLEELRPEDNADESVPLAAAA